MSELVQSGKVIGTNRETPRAESLDSHSIISDAARVVSMKELRESNPAAFYRAVDKIAGIGIATLPEDYFEAEGPAEKTSEARKWIRSYAEGEKDCIALEVDKTILAVGRGSEIVGAMLLNPLQNVGTVGKVVWQDTHLEAPVGDGNVIQKAIEKHHLSSVDVNTTSILDNDLAEYISKHGASMLVAEDNRFAKYNGRTAGEARVALEARGFVSIVDENNVRIPWIRPDHQSYDMFIKPLDGRTEMTGAEVKALYADLLRKGFSDDKEEGFTPRQKANAIAKMNAQIDDSRIYKFAAISESEDRKRSTHSEDRKETKRIIDELKNGAFVNSKYVVTPESDGRTKIATTTGSQEWVVSADGVIESNTVNFKPRVKAATRFARTENDGVKVTNQSLNRILTDLSSTNY